MSETTVNLSDQPPKKHKKPARVSRRVAVFGTFILIFAIIGVIATVIGATQLTANLIENKAQKDRFKQVVFPLVLLDPPAFDSIDKLDSRTILSAAIWDFIIFDDKSKYQKDDLNYLTVLAVDIEAHIVNLFGQDAAIEHQEIADAELQVLYDPESKSYSIPATATMATYVPDIESISRKGDTYTVKVGYLPSGPIWGSDITGLKYEPEPDKYLNYILKKTGKDSYIITAVQEIKEGTVSSDISSAVSEAETSAPADSSAVTGSDISSGSSNSNTSTVSSTASK